MQSKTAYWPTEAVYAEHPDMRTRKMPISTYIECFLDHVQDEMVSIDSLYLLITSSLLVSYRQLFTASVHDADDVLER